MDFFKKKARTIYYILVVIAVALSIYIKLTGNESEIFFKQNDVYIIAGIALGVVVLTFFKNRSKK